MVKTQSCIEVFIMFTCRGLLWAIKDKGESWPNKYFRDIILTQNVFPFLKNEENAIDPDEVRFVHGKAPCIQANKTQRFFFKTTMLNFEVMASCREIHLISM